MEIFIPLFIFVPIGLLVIGLSTRRLPPDERHWISILLVVAFLLRAGLCLIFVSFEETRIYHWDAQSYENIGMYLAASWRGEAPPLPIPEVNWGYYELSGAVYYVFGRYRANASLLNAILGTMLTLLVYNMTKKLFHQVVARRAALLIALMPSMVLWGSMALKDVVVTFCIVMSLSSCVQLKQKFSLSALLGTLLPILAIYPMRFYIVFCLAFAIVVSLTLDRSLSALSGIYKQVFLISLVGGLLFLLSMTDQGGADPTQYASLEFVSQYRRGMAVSANTGYGGDVDLSTPGSALAYLPIGIAQLLFAPFPWQMTSLGTLVAAPETIFWWTLFPASVRGIVFAVRNRFSEVLPLLAFTVVLTLVYSLMQGNIGAAFRQRAQILVFLFVFSALGKCLSKARAVGVPPESLLQDSKAQDES